MAQIQATQQPPPTLVQPVKEESPQVNGHTEETSMETNEEEVTKEVLNKSTVVMKTLTEKWYLMMFCSCYSEF